MHSTLLRQTALKQDELPHKKRRWFLLERLVKKGISPSGFYLLEPGQRDMRGKGAFLLSNPAGNHSFTNLAGQLLQTGMRLQPYPQYPRPMTTGEATRPAKAKPEFVRLNARQCPCQPLYLRLCHLAQEGQGQVNLFRRYPAGTLDFNPQLPQCHLEISGEFNGDEESHNCTPGHVLSCCMQGLLVDMQEPAVQHDISGKPAAGEQPGSQRSHQSG